MEREREKFFPPPHSQLHCFHTPCCRPPSPWKRPGNQEQPRERSSLTSNLTLCSCTVHMAKSLWTAGASCWLFLEDVSSWSRVLKYKLWFSTFSSGYSRETKHSLYVLLYLLVNRPTALHYDCMLQHSDFTSLELRGSNTKVWCPHTFGHRVYVLVCVNTSFLSFLPSLTVVYII